jgi:hypothetical protein
MNGEQVDHEFISRQFLRNWRRSIQVNQKIQQQRNRWIG